MSHYSGSIPDTITRTRDWTEHAACAGHNDAMFPDNDTRGIAAAKNICRPCPVWRECLLDALRTGDNQWGIRGALKPEERRAIAKQANGGPIELPKPLPPRKQRPATLAEAVRRCTTRTSDGHLAWNGSTCIRFAGQRYTALQAAFIAGYGREPVGHVRRTCGQDCFRADHLADTSMREADAVCGTAPGYRKHKKYGEQPCRPCLAAHTADTRPKAVTV